MINPTGFLTANGITGQDLLRILEIKIHHRNSPTFNPARLQSGIAVGLIIRPPISKSMGWLQIVYNNVVFGWANESGLLIGEKIAHYPSQERGAGEGCSALTLQHFDCEVASSDLPPPPLRYFLGHDSLDGTAITRRCPRG